MTRMSLSYSLNRHCTECGAILVNLRDSFQPDQQEVRSHLRDTAQATDRSLEDMRNVWLWSLVNCQTTSSEHWNEFITRALPKPAGESLPTKLARAIQCICMAGRRSSHLDSDHDKIQMSPPPVRR
jgi:hypothetical protein